MVLGYNCPKINYGKWDGPEVSLVFLPSTGGNFYGNDCLRPTHIYRSSVVTIITEISKECKEEIKPLPPMEYLVNELLERSAVKVARSVLRGGRRSDPPVLPDEG